MTTRIGHVMIGIIHTGIWLLMHLLAVTLETPTSWRKAPVETNLKTPVTVTVQ